MDQVLFSTSLSPYDGTITNTALQQTLEEIAISQGAAELFQLKWSDSQLAVRLEIAVQLPPLGNYKGIDIRVTEPVLAVFSLQGYPSVAPWICSDRLDFPANRMGHMYVSHNGKPGGFCLVRGNMSEWYANKRPKDLLIRIENWLRDGAAGELNENGDQFEPLRLEGYRAKIVFDYDLFYSVANEKKSLPDHTNYSMALFERSSKGEETIVSIQEVFDASNHEKLMKNFNAERELHVKGKGGKNYHIGYILWPVGNEVYDDYCVTLPSNWKEFKDFCFSFGIETSILEDHLTSADENMFKMVPIIVAIRRPRPLIGFSGDIEFVSFFTFLEKLETVEGKLSDQLEVHFFQHLQPLTVKKAQEISGLTQEFEGINLVVGCGALGSKVSMHMARSGLVYTFHTDNDYLAPHNLVRHVGFRDGVGMNKAKYIESEIEKMYSKDESLLSAGFTLSGQAMLTDPYLKMYRNVIDFTASASFFNFLVTLKKIEKIRINKGAIVDGGNIGMLMVEGKERNPRIDDLQSFLYLQAFSDPEIEAWLKREASENTAAIDTKVGIGCNSETVILADDTVSYHASYMSRVLKHETRLSVESAGKIFLHMLSSDRDYNVKAKVIDVPKMEVLTAVNDPEWQIRIIPGILNQMRTELAKAYPKETGGLFIGQANFKTKTVHVMGLIEAPSDSMSNQVCFCRGVHGLKGAVDHITEKTGGQLGYIGEWHTHPEGPNGISHKDAQTMAEFKTEFEQLSAPLPVFLMVVTPDGVFPYVY